ncbi:unnamed protein product [Diplocarpon coronariae]
MIRSTSTTQGHVTQLTRQGLSRYPAACHGARGLKSMAGSRSASLQR